jgi:hypothetical protein
MKKLSPLADLPVREGRRMNTVCPKCAYRRGPVEVVSDRQCPKCGVVYDRYLALMARRDHEAATTQAEPVRVVRDPRASPPDPPMPKAPTPWSRYLGLAAAFLLLVGMIGISVHERRVDAGGAAGPSPLSGVYEGSATREIPLSGGGPYGAEYSARFTVGEDGRVSQITWTDGSNLLDQATVSWSPSARVEYTLLVRDDYTRSFEDPPRGEYNRLTRDGSSYRVVAVHPGSADLRRFEYAGQIPLGVGVKETVTTGLFRASKTETGASEADIHAGLPKMGRVEAALGEVTCELAESAANRALQPYLLGEKALPDGSPVDLGKPIDGVDIERVMVPRWPGRLWVDFHGVRVRTGSGMLDAKHRQISERLPQVEMSDTSRIILDFFDSIGWEARVVCLPDGRTVVRIPARNIEIPVERVEEVTSVEEVIPVEEVTSVEE